MAALLLALAGCAAGPDFVRPDPPSVDRYTSEPLPKETAAANGQKQQFHHGEKIAADWWRLFNSREVEAAVRQAIAGNPNLQSAQASLRQSQENLRAGYGVFYPTIDTSFTATREKLSPFRFGANTPGGGGVFNLFTLGATISYTLDLFGGQRRTVEGLAAQADFQRYAMLGTYMTLCGNVVNAMIARAAYQEQLAATEQLIEVQKEQLAIAETQASAGIVPYVNVLGIKSQLASNEAILPVLRQRRDQSHHLLASLLGSPPSETMPVADLTNLTLPPDLPVSLPSDLVRQRPDILAAEAQLHASSALIGVATANLFPSFSLNGGYGLSNTTIGNLSNSNSKFWNIGPQVNYSLFQGGASWYRRRAAIEGYQKSLADYRQTVLGAFQQVADALKALEHDALGLRAQADSLSAAEDALKIRQANYRAGLVSYLDVLNANAQFYQAKTNYLQTLAQRYQDTTALFVALGGGWWNDEQLRGGQSLKGSANGEEKH